jgi:hypothetical protein
MKLLKPHLIALVFFPLICTTAWAQASLPFGQVTTGTITTVGSTNSYTFSANAGDVVDFTVATTSGKLSPKIQLYSPSPGVTLIGTAYPHDAYGNCSGGATVEMNTVLLAAAGSYTVVLGDCSEANIGTYDIYFQRTNNPLEASTLPFGQTTAGAVTLQAQSNTYTFSANANDVVDFTLITTDGNFSPKIRLYGPTGAYVNQAFPHDAYGNCDGGATVELNTVTLATTGTYTVLVGDCSDTNSGSYEIDAQKTDGGSGTPLLFGQVQAGSITSPTQSNTFTFNANANDVVDFTLLTSSGKLSPKIRLYGPSGAYVDQAFPHDAYGNCNDGAGIEMNTVTLTSAGTYTVLVGDCTDVNTGTYSIYSQRTNNPANPSPLPFGLTQSGLIGAATQSNTYTFSANANDIVNFTLATTSGKLSPKIRLYDPSGAYVNQAYPHDAYGNCNGGATVELNTIALAAAGTYTVLVGDCSDANTGNYSIYAQRINNPSGASSFAWGGQTQTGAVGSAAQSNTWTFSANASSTVLNLNVVTTSGSLSPKIRLYFQPTGTLLSTAYPRDAYGNCNGGSNITMSSVSLAQAGTYTVLVGDCSDTNTGNYNISGQCIGCLVTPTITWPAPAPIAYLTPLSATQLDAAASSSGSPLTGNYAYSYSCVPASGPATSGTAAIGTVLPAGSCTLSVTFTPTDTTDYSNATASVPLTVGQATPPITWPPPAPITYGTALSGTQLDASSTVPGVFSPYVPAAGAVLTAGLQTLSVTFTPTDTNDYKTVIPTNQLTVNQATPACSWPAPAAITNPTPLSAAQLDASCSWTVGGVPVTVPGNYAYTYASASSSGAANIGTVLPAGSYTLSVNFTPTDTTDYKAYTGSVPLTVNPPSGTVVITWPPLTPITYGTALSSTQLDATATVGGTAVAGTFIYSASGVGTVKSGTVLPANPTPYSLTAAFTPTNKSYTAPSPYPNSLTVNQATPVIGWPTPAAILTTTPLSATQLDASATWKVNGVTVKVAGNYAYSYACPSGSGTATIGTLLPAGECTLSVAFTPTDTVDYLPPAPSSVKITVSLPTLAKPTFLPIAGTYGAAQLVAIAATPGAAIYYAIGKTPTASSTPYTTPILVSASETLEAIAVETGYNSSPVATAAYKIVGSPSALAEPATAIETPTATLNALVNTNGLTGNYVFQYGTSSSALSLTTPTTALPASTTATTVSVPIGGLVSGTTFYFQVVVSTAGGTVTGAVLNFTAN